MTDMKQGWEIKKLVDICELITCGVAARPKYVDIGIPFLSAKNVKDGKIIWSGFNCISETTHKELTKNNKPELGDILYTRVGSYGEAAVIEDGNEFSVFVSLTLIKVDKHVLNNYFLKHYLNSDFVKKLAKSSISGSGVGNLNVGTVREFPIPLPPLPEQQRIVSILDQTFAAIAKAKANAEQNLKNAKELFESYLQGVFENKGEGWNEKYLEDLADEKCSLSYGIVQPGEEYLDGLPIIRPTDLTSRFIGLQGLKRIDPKLANGYKRTKLIGDELLLCVRGTTGVVSIAIGELKGANVTRGIVPIRFNSNIINQEFGYYLLVSNYIQKQIKAKTYGAALMQINIGDLRKILTPYPPLKEQQTIVSRLDALSCETKRLEAIYQQKINNLEELKKSVLQKAFNGEL